MDVVVYTHYYQTRTANRQLEIDECLRRNLKHPRISKVVLFKEADAPPLPQASVSLEVVESDEPITYAEWFRWVKHLESGIGLLLNTDMYPDEGLGNLGQRDMWGLRAYAGLPESLLCVSNFPLAFPGWDNHIAYVMWSQGHRLGKLCHQMCSVHLQASTARSHNQPGDQLYVCVSHLEPSLMQAEDPELDFTIRTRLPQQSDGELIDQQAIELGVHQLRQSEVEVLLQFLNLQMITGLGWVHEAMGSIHLRGNVHRFVNEETVFLPLPALLDRGVELLLPRPTRLEGLTLRVPRRTQGFTDWSWRPTQIARPNCRLKAMQAFDFSQTRTFWHPEHEHQGHQHPMG